MKTISFSAAVLFASAVLLTGVVFTAAAQDTKAPPAEGAPAASTAALPMANMTQMNHITTQAQAEALKPGDSMSMTCSKCKDVMVQKVTADNAHVKMMTVGEKVTCGPCGGTVEVVATGKGTGKDAEVKHVCSICGDDAMFCAATAPGSGSMKNMKDMDKAAPKATEKAAKPKMSEEEMKKMKKQQ